MDVIGDMNSVASTEPFNFIVDSSFKTEKLDFHKDWKTSASYFKKYFLGDISPEKFDKLKKAYEKHKNQIESKETKVKKSKLKP